MSEDGARQAAVLNDIKADTEAVIALNLQDPDLRVKSAEYQAGYAQGFREAAYTFTTHRIKRGRP